MVPPRHMITFATDGILFVYRVGGVILHNGRVLCQRAARTTPPYWFLPGGRAELLESAATTLQREVEEELDLTPTIVRPLAIIENFFGQQPRATHEIGLYFLLGFPEDAYIYQQSSLALRDKDGSRASSNEELLYFDWLPLEEIERAPLYPRALHTLLKNLPEHFQHIVSQ
ncbi:NUDIX hydrolase [Ktedonobacter robiniae]|uniref:DNA mismatch repair protein MutT n=1 Tax=Ktedonobacter robiniae TaxID=2778365 RepID=A0ABQ3ULE1_9CHLR|nr:NUDIX domain-containing protein [Ktedonobacter robiniae]GHO53477.1 DNA mismatch repair protein MutT [Ktedonobacter robiniae]